MRMRLLIAPVLVALLVTAAAPPSDASGIHRLRSHYRQGEVITAESRFGNGSIRSVVRRGRLGWKVRLPSGNWTDCRRSCEETLRVKTIDYYEGNSIDDGGYGSLARVCGIFGCLGGSYEFSF